MTTVSPTLPEPAVNRPATAALVLMIANSRKQTLAGAPGELNLTK